MSILLPLHSEIHVPHGEPSLNLASCLGKGARRGNGNGKSRIRCGEHGGREYWERQLESGGISVMTRNLEKWKLKNLEGDSS